MCILLFAFFLHFCFVKSWNVEELELFDLVEEINRNFYEVFEVEQTASNSAIRKAYYKLSLLYHPDKNSDPNAEQIFRQMSAIYEVLKDEVKRKRYDELLVSGLPDWRQPIFYYRRAKKLSILELFLLLILAITVGHSAFLWTSYFERRFELSEVLKSKKKKDKKKKKQKTDDISVDTESEFQTEIDSQISKPSISDIWLYQLLCGCLYLGRNIYNWLKLCKESYRFKKNKETDDEDVLDKNQINKRRYRTYINFSDKSLPKESAVSYDLQLQSLSNADQTTQESNNFNQLQSNSYSQTQHDSSELQLSESNQPWSEETYSLLTKAMNKYPTGTVQRWEKIAFLLNRSEKEIMEKVKEMKKKGFVPSSDDVPRPVPISRQLTSSKVNGKLKDSTADGSVSELKVNFQTSDENKLSSGDVESANILLQNSSASQLNDCNNDKKPTSKNKEIIANPQKALPSEEEKKSLKVSASEAWSVQQQKMLEWALANVPKKSADRWDQIADHVSGKTKEECIARVKYLAEFVRQKKSLTG